MATSAQYAATAQNYSGDILVTKTNDWANGTSANLVTLATGGASGTRIDDISFVALGTTTGSAQLILYIGDGTAANARPWKGLQISAVTVSATQAAWGQTLYDQGLVLKSGWKLYGSVSVSPGVTVASTVTRAGDF